LKILCTDDSRLTRKMIQDVIETLGCEFVGAVDGEETKRLIEKHHTDLSLVLLDWNIPGPDGLEILRWLKASDPYRNIPVIMVTAMGHQGKIDEALEAGADDYITKPFDLDDLACRIKKCLSRG